MVLNDGWLGPIEVKQMRRQYPFSPSVRTVLGGVPDEALGTGGGGVRDGVTYARAPDFRSLEEAIAGCAAIRRIVVVGSPAAAPKDKCS